MLTKEVIIEGSTIIYGKYSVPIFEHVRRFVITKSCIKHPTFTWRSVSNNIRELILLTNDYYGVVGFDLVYHLLNEVDRFKNLTRFEFEGQIEEESISKLILKMQKFPHLRHVRLINKGTFFNPKIITGNE